MIDLAVTGHCGRLLPQADHPPASALFFRRVRQSQHRVRGRGIAHKQTRVR